MPPKRPSPPSKAKRPPPRAPRAKRPPPGATSPAAATSKRATSRTPAPEASTATESPDAPSEGAPAGPDEAGANVTAPPTSTDQAGWLGEILTCLIRLDDNCLGKDDEKRAGAVEAFAWGMWSPIDIGENRFIEREPLKRPTADQLRKAAKIIRFVAGVVVDGASWPVLEDMHDMLMETSLRRARVVFDVEWHIGSYHKSQFADGVVRSLLAMISAVDERFSELDSREVHEILKDASPEDASKGGSGNLGAPGVTADLCLRCGAFDEQRKANETFEAARTRIAKNFANARTRAEKKRV